MLVLPTSNLSEMFFSVADYGLYGCWKSLLSSDLEKQLFSNASLSLWGIEDVKRVINKKYVMDYYLFWQH